MRLRPTLVRSPALEDLGRFCLQTEVLWDETVAKTITSALKRYPTHTMVGHKQKKRDPAPGWRNGWRVSRNEWCALPAANTP